MSPLPVLVRPTMTLPVANMLRRRIALEVRHPEMTEDDHHLLVQAMGSVSAAISDAEDEAKQ